MIGFVSFTGLDNKNNHQRQTPNQREDAVLNKYLGGVCIT